MEVNIQNDGPVTLEIESSVKKDDNWEKTLKNVYFLNYYLLNKLSNILTVIPSRL